MNWYYVVNGQQVGPVTQADFDNLVTGGGIRPDTLVWREGMPEWQTYASLNPGTPPVTTPTGVSADTVQTRDYTVDIGGTISAAWSFYKANFGSVLGATLIVFGVSVGIGCIPILGPLANMIIQGPLIGGLYLFLLGKIRGEGVTPSHVFVGFKTNFAGLLLGCLMPGLLICLCFIPAAIFLLIGILSQLVGHNTWAGGQFVFNGTVIAGIAIGAITVFVAIYLQNCWIFTLALVADKGLSFWPAMKLSRAVVGKHWWGIFGLMFVAGLVAGLGILACGIGIIFTLPLVLVIQMHQYEKLFGDLTP